MMANNLGLVINLQRLCLIDILDKTEIHHTILLMNGKTPDSLLNLIQASGVKHQLFRWKVNSIDVKGEILAVINYHIFVLHNKRLLQDIARLQ